MIFITVRWYYATKNHIKECFDENTISSLSLCAATFIFVNMVSGKFCGDCTFTVYFLDIWISELTLPSGDSCTGILFVPTSLWSPCWRWVTAQTERGVDPDPSWSATLAPKPGKSPGAGAPPAPLDPPPDLSQDSEIFFSNFYFSGISHPRVSLYCVTLLPSSMLTCIASLARFGTLSITSRPSLISPLPSSQHASNSCKFPKKSVYLYICLYSI